MEYRITKNKQKQLSIFNNPEYKKSNNKIMRGVKEDG